MCLEEQGNKLDNLIGQGLDLDDHLTTLHDW